MRRKSVAIRGDPPRATPDSEWGLRNDRAKGGKTRDIPLPQPVSHGGASGRYDDLREIAFDYARLRSAAPGPRPRR